MDLDPITRKTGQESVKTTRDPKGLYSEEKLKVDRIEWGIREQLTVDIEDKRKEQPLMFSEKGNSRAEVKTSPEYEISAACCKIYGFECQRE